LLSVIMTPNIKIMIFIGRREMKKIYFRLSIILLILCWMGFGETRFSFAQDALNQKVMELDARLTAIEKYLENLPVALGDISQNILENVDRKLLVESGKIVSLDLVSQEFSKVDTNVGTFLVAIGKREKTKNRCILYLQVGNPHAVTFKGATMKIRWGSQWNPDSINQTYQQWRESLIGYEYSYSGELKSGQWTEIAVELVPVDDKFEYVEFQMDVNSVELTEKSRY